MNEPKTNNGPIARISAIANAPTLLDVAAFELLFVATLLDVAAFEAKQTERNDERTESFARVMFENLIATVAGC